MRQYIYSLIMDERDGFVAALVKSILSFTSFFYGLSVKAIRSIRIFAAKGLPCRVISVGNLTLGGTGKTPTACMLARLLKEEGRDPAVLIRGYGDDEWRMMERLLGDIPVLVGRDRVASGKRALSSFSVDTLILDDGFQHWALKRNLDIILVDSTNPFGNRRLFPRGILREDIKDLKRADIIMLTKTDMGMQRIKEIRDELKRRVPDSPVLESIHNPLNFYDLNGKEEFELSFIKDRRVLALSSIVNTEYFEYTLKSLGANIVSSFHYPDHYDYKENDLTSIIDECKRSDIDTIVTTEKDAVKLIEAQPRSIWYRGLASILVLHVEVKVTDGEQVLRERLRSLYSG